MWRKKWENRTASLSRCEKWRVYKMEVTKDDRWEKKKRTNHTRWIEVNPCFYKKEKWEMGVTLNSETKQKKKQTNRNGVIMTAFTLLCAFFLGGGRLDYWQKYHHTISEEKARTKNSLENRRSCVSKKKKIINKKKRGESERWFSLLLQRLQREALTRLGEQDREKKRWSKAWGQFSG